MPKMKSHSGAAARFALTAGGKKGGKLVRRRTKMNHLLSKKTSRAKRRLNSEAVVSGGDRRGVRRMLGI